jgi:hypothetical protein
MSLMRFALVARHPSATNEALAAARAGNARWETMSPEFALETLRSGDAALGRLDVLHTLDGVEDGLWALGALAARGVLVLNDAAALLGTHDKLLTAWLLRRAGVVHPTTLHVRPGRPFPAVRPPAVVKPRYGAGVRTSYAATTSARLWAPSRSSPTRVGSVGTERSSRSSSRRRGTPSGSSSLLREPSERSSGSRLRASGGRTRARRCAAAGIRAPARGVHARDRRREGDRSVARGRRSAPGGERRLDCARGERGRRVHPRIRAFGRCLRRCRIRARPYGARGQERCRRRPRCCCLTTEMRPRAATLRRARRRSSVG